MHLVRLLPSVLAAALLLLGVGVGTPPVAAKPDVNGKIIPPTTKFRGLSYGEWEALWWQTAFSIPIVDGSHPLFTGGAFGEHNGVVFLAGVSGGVTINVSIHPGSPVFVPLINFECSVYEGDPFHGDDEAELRACANGFLANVSGLAATLDGVSVKKIETYRVESPLFVFGPLPEPNLVGAPAGTTSPSVDAGYYLLLAPLATGHHTLQVKATSSDLGGFSIDTTFNITVTPK